MEQTSKSFWKKPILSFAKFPLKQYKLIHIVHTLGNTMIKKTHIGKLHHLRFVFLSYKKKKKKIADILIKIQFANIS